jgi:predicted MFS family arabinose efflux permease
MVGLVQVIPAVGLALPAGYLADHRSRTSMILVALGIQVAAVAGLAAVCLAEAPLVWAYGLLAVESVGMALARPSASSLLPQLVPVERLGNAVTWRTLGWQVGEVAGPALGGLALVALGGPGPAIAGAAVVVALASILVLRMERRGPAAGSAGGAAESLLAGFRFVRSEPRILASITLDMLAVLLGGSVALLPIFARDVFRVGEAGLGWLRAAPAVGAVAMALVLAHRRSFRRPGVVLLAAVAGFGLATVGFGLSRSVWVALGCLLVAGALDNVSVVIRGTLVQRLTPDAMRGRVAAVNGLFISLSNEMGAFESGVTAAWWGVVPAVVVGGVGCMLVVGLVAWRWPELVRAREV